MSPRGCAILVDAAGHVHEVPLKYCTSFQVSFICSFLVIESSLLANWAVQQLKNMLPVLLTPQRSGASVQRRYIESGKFDFCIDDGKRVARVTSDSSEWPKIQEGTKVVMRVVFEQMTAFSATYTCHLCGASNHLGSFGNSVDWLTDGSVDWFVRRIHGWKCISYRKAMLAREDFRSRSS